MIRLFLDKGWLALEPEEFKCSINSVAPKTTRDAIYFLLKKTRSNVQTNVAEFMKKEMF